MATLGSTTKPTTTQVYYGLNTKNQQAIPLTLPPGGPWKITDLGGWLAGVDVGVSTQLCLWTSGGTLVRNSSTFTAAGQPFAAFNATNYERSITAYVVSGGTTVYVGWSRDPGGEHQFPVTGSGTRRDDTQTGSWPGSLSGYESATGLIGAYLTYSASNTLPDAPSLVSPAASARITDLTPDFIFDHNDDDGDPLDVYDITVDNNADFGTPLWDIDHQSSGISGDRATRTYAGTALTRGDFYYWRARTADVAGYGPYATRSFRVNSLPTATKVSPLAGALATVHNLTTDLTVWTSGGSHAKPKFDWTFADADGDSQSAYRVKVYSAATAGTTLHDSGIVTSSTTLYNSTWAGVLGTEYWWTIDVKDPYGEWAGESSRTAFKMRWSQAIYEYAVPGGASSSAWAWASAQSGTGTVTFVFSTATGAAGAGRSAWKSQVGELTPAAYLNVLVRLAATTAGSGPSLADMTFSYIATAIFPERWTFGTVAGDFALDPAVRRFGSQSLRLTRSTTVGERVAYPFTKVSGDDFPVSGDTEYTASVYVKTDGVLGAAVIIEVRDPSGVAWSGATIIDNSNDRTTNSAAAPEGWQRIWVRFRTDSVDTIRLAIYQPATGSAVGNKFWMDAVQVEESAMATPWQPGLVGNPVVVDVNGIIVDRTAGGIFRLRAETGGAANTIELGPSGLLFGGDVELYNASAGVLELSSGARIHGNAEDWTAVTFAGTWTNFGGTLGTAAYRKDAQGYVHLKGIIKSGTINTTAFTLPVGYRPVSDTRFASVSDSAFGVLIVMSSGAVTPNVGSNVSFALDGVTFKAV